MTVYVKPRLKQLYSIKPHISRELYPHWKDLLEITFHGSVFIKIFWPSISKHFVDIPQWINQVQK